MPESRLEELRRAEADAKKDWERAVQAVRMANEEANRAHQRYKQAWKAVAEENVRPARPKMLVAKAN